MSHDTALHRLVRPAVRPLASTGVTPNQLTTLRLATGLAAALAFAQGGVLWPAVGAGVMLLSLALDRADGELARQTGRASQGGYRYDLICDCIATVTGFLGMGWGAQQVLGPTAAVLGVVAGVSVATVFWQINVIKLAAAEGYRSPDGRVLFDPDDAMLAAPFLIWLGLMPWVVGVAAVATPIVALALGLIGWRRSRKVASGLGGRR